MLSCEFTPQRLNLWVGVLDSTQRKAVCDLDSGEHESQQGDLLGPYRILEKLGAGGMGVVYAAWDTRLERKVALKMVRGHLLSDATVKRRFLREAKAAARIEHPNVVRVYRLEPIGDQLAIEMQYIDGTPMSAMLRGTPLPLSHVLGFMEQALTALRACHELGVVHCDLKPANLLITEDRHVYLADFGIARALDRSALEDTIRTSTTGPFWGTPRYCPPEAWDDGTPDFRWDLYALGVVIYEALTAETAFHGNTPAAVMKQVVLSAPTPIEELRPDVSAELAGLVRDLMAREPEQRPDSARAALARLHALPEYGDSQAETLPLPRPKSRKRRKGLAGLNPSRKSLLAALALAILLTIGGTTTLLRHGRSDEGPSTTRGELTSTGATRPPEPAEFTPTASAAHFVYDDGVHGPELWYATTSGKAGIARDIVPGSQGSFPRRLFHLPGSNVVLFSARTPEHGEELWVSRKYGPGKFQVEMVRDIIPGTMGSEPRCFGSVDGLILLYATTLDAGRELWITNTREQQTAMITDLFPGRHGSNLMDPNAAMGDHVMYFLGRHDITQGTTLFSYRVQEHQVREIAELFDNARAMAMVGDTLVFANKDDKHGVEPWQYHPGDGRIQLLADLAPGPVSSNPGEMIAWNGRVYFHAESSEAGQEPWVTDGTAEGTRLLHDINPGQAGSNPYGFIDGGPLLFFRATDATHGKELWMTDGTMEGTQLVADIWAGPESADPYSMAAAGDRLFFTAREPEFGEELYVYRYNDRAVTRLSDFWPGPQGSEPYEFAVVGNNVGMFRLKLPGGKPAIGIIHWNGSTPRITTTPLPFVDKSEAD